MLWCRCFSAAFSFSDIKMALRIDGARWNITWESLVWSETGSHLLLHPRCMLVQTPPAMVQHSTDRGMNHTQSHYRLKLVTNEGLVWWAIWKKMVFSVQIPEDRCPHFRNYFQTGTTWHSQKRVGGKDLKEHSKSKNIFVSELYLPTMACELWKERLNPAVMLLIVAVSRSQKYFNMAKKHLFHLLLLHIAPFYTIISSACFQLYCFTEISPSCQVRTQVESI